MLPPKPDSVRDHQYVVQPGDSASKIAQTITGEWRRWPELVGANMHLGTVGSPDVPYRVFRQLQPGDRLYIPSSWPGPGNVGTRPQYEAINDILTPIWSQMVTTWEQQRTAGVPIPARLPTQEQMAHILYSWFPTLQSQVDPAAPPIEQNPAYWTALIAQAMSKAIQWLANSKADPETASNIPWESPVVWEFPWQGLRDLSQQAGITFMSLLEFMMNAMKGTAAQTPGNLSFLVPTGGFVIGPHGFVGEPPPVLTTDWSNPAYQAIPWDVLAQAPREFLTALSDPRVAPCIQQAGAAARLQKMIGCKDCYIGKGTDQFVAGLCGTGDPCACNVPPLPTPPEPRPPTDEEPEVTPPAEAEEKKSNTLAYIGLAGLLGLGAIWLLKK